MSFIRTTQSELYKLIFSRGWWIVFSLVIILQPLLGLLETSQIASIGLDATPETHPELLESLPPLDYFGFDAAMFGILPIVIFGGICGASEYRNHNLRTTMLCNNNRASLFLAKLKSIILSTILVSFTSVFITIAITHVGLGSAGLNPIILSKIAWQFIGYTVLTWTLLTVLSFTIGILFKNTIIPLVFLVPQIYNLGNYLAEKWTFGEYLPIAAGNLIITTPVKSMPHDPIKGVLIISLWIIVSLMIALYSFVHSDVGGEY
ncbi:ABC transporter permease [Listeria monocytogenes]|nr:ABC transporter permease [Listeria monocytogenes]ECB9834702.1 ABC transporter permease [Listeria monocytogenes]